MKIYAVNLYRNNNIKQSSSNKPTFYGNLNMLNPEPILHKMGFCMNDIKIISEYIIKTYNRPERGYHGIKHLTSMLESFDIFLQESNQAFLVQNPNEFKFAILMHDYFNGISGEVEKSAAMAENFTKKISPNYDFSYIKDLILATDYSKKQNLTFDQQLMQDIDIEILGKPFDEYRKYYEAIRQQYSNYPNEIYNPARIKVLKAFLSKENIYNTKYYQNMYETQAIENIKQEISILNNHL